MPSSLDYLGRSWGGQNSKSVGGAVRSRTGKCTTNADAVRTEDRNFWRGAGRGQKFSARDISSIDPLLKRKITSSHSIQTPFFCWELISSVENLTKDDDVNVDIFTSNRNVVGRRFPFKNTTGRPCCLPLRTTRTAAVHSVDHLMQCMLPVFLRRIEGQKRSLIFFQWSIKIQ